MIIVKLIGGLGNQLFQYATARRLALKHEVALKFDLHSFQNDEKRDFGLSHFQIQGSIASLEEIKGLKERKPSVLGRILQKQSLVPYYPPVIKSPDYGFDKGMLKAGSNHYLRGYWAHEGYFADIRPLLLQEFSLKEKSHSSTYKEAVKNIRSANTVSVHFRRGDYAKNTDTLAFFGLMPLDYYMNAIIKMKEKEDKPNFLIFTDDVAWVRENLRLTEPVQFVQDFGPLMDYEEMMLMAACKHNIVANSTFSWWGAWLNQHPSKIVIAPKNWYQNKEAQKHYESSGFIPSNWIKL